MLEFGIHDIFDRLRYPDVDVADKYVMLYLAWLQISNSDGGELRRFDRSILLDIENEELRRMVESRVVSRNALEIDHVFFQLNRYAHDADLIKSAILINETGFTRPRPYSIFSAPTLVLKLASDLLDVNEDESFADFYCGKGEMMISGEVKSRDITCYDISDTAVLISMIRSEVQGKPARFELKDLLRDEVERSFDKIFAEPPFGLKYDPKSLSMIQYATGMPIRERQSDWATVASAIKSLNDGGRAVFILPAGTAFNSRSEEIREYLINNQLLSTVIEFPAGTYPFSVVNILMYVFERKPKSSVRMVNLSKMNSDMSKYRVMSVLESNMPEIIDACRSSQDTPISKMVSYEEVLNRSGKSLLPSSYFSEEFGFSCNEQCLNGCVTIYKGINVSGDEMDESGGETDYVSINISDIQDCVLTKKSYISEARTSVRSICTIKEGFGYLITSRMLNHRKTCVLEEKVGRRIFSGNNTFILEFSQEVLNPYYLQYCFVHSEGKLFSNLGQGSVLPLLTSRSFEDMKIPVPDMETQLRIASSFKETLDKIQETKKVMAQLDEELKALDLFKGVLTK